MPVSLYECMLLLDANKVAGDLPTTVEQLKGIFTRNNAEILANRPWDERRLAFTIAGQKKGLYYLTYFKAEGKELTNIGRDLHLNETVIRHMVLHIDPKLEDIMLALARDEHALALQTVQEGADDDMMGGGGDDRGRRGPRRD